MGRRASTAAAGTTIRKGYRRRRLGRKTRTTNLSFLSCARTFLTPAEESIEPAHGSSKSPDLLQLANRLWLADLEHELGWEKLSETEGCRRSVGVEEGKHVQND